MPELAAKVGSAAARLIVIAVIGDGEDDDKMVMVLSELRQEPSDGNQTPNLGRLADQLGRVAAAGYQTASKPK